MYIAEEQKNNTYDAIVVGSGVSGAYAAKERAAPWCGTTTLNRGRRKLPIFS